MRIICKKRGTELCRSRKCVFNYPVEYEHVLFDYGLFLTDDLHDNPDGFLWWINIADGHETNCCGNFIIFNGREDENGG